MTEWDCDPADSFVDLHARDRAALNGFTAIAQDDFAGAAVQARVAREPGGNGGQFDFSGSLSRLLDHHHQPQPVPELSAEQWSALSPGELIIAAQEVLAVHASGGTVPIGVVDTALTAVRPKLLSDQPPTPPPDGSSAPGHDLESALRAFPERFVAVWLGLAGQLEAAAASTLLGRAATLDPEAQRRSLLDAADRAMQADRLFGHAVQCASGQDQARSSALGAAENEAVLGRIMLALNRRDDGRTLLRQAERNLPAGSSAHAEVLVDLAIDAADTGDWDEVAGFAVPALLVLDDLRHQHLVRERRLVATGKADIARELALTAADRLGDHRLLAELVCHAARFGRYLPLAAAAQRSVELAALAESAGLVGDGSSLVVLPIPSREWPWPSRLDAYAGEFGLRHP